MGADIAVEEALNEAPVGWDEFVARRRSCSAYHRSPAVLIGHRAYGLPTYFLAARRPSSEIVGVLPLVEQRSRLFGHHLISLPFFNYGGIVADFDDAEEALLKAAEELRTRLGANHVELRHVRQISRPALKTRNDKVSMVLELPASREELAKRLGSKLRSQIKRAEREDPTVTWGGAELLPLFYKVYCVSMRDLGTPVPPMQFFRSTLRALASAAHVVVIGVRGNVEAAAILVHHGECLEVPWAVASSVGKRLSVNMRLYWEMLSFAIDHGCAKFDFGRSTRESGTYRFKAQWGAAPVQLHWHYLMNESDRVPS